LEVQDESTAIFYGLLKNLESGNLISPLGLITCEERVCHPFKNVLLPFVSYDTSADELDENMKITTNTILECLGKFAPGVIDVFEEQYLRPPNQDVVEQLLQFGESCDFPGMLGSIDCMHW
jgi:hypothetical protein